MGRINPLECSIEGRSAAAINIVWVTVVGLAGPRLILCQFREWAKPRNFGLIDMSRCADNGGPVWLGQSAGAGK